MSELPQFGRTLIVLGLLIAGFGIVLSLAGNVSWLGNLPGDIHVEGENYSLYFPLTTCLLLSFLLSLGLYLFNFLTG
jgi:hypothetical protein